MVGRVCTLLFFRVGGLRDRACVCVNGFSLGEISRTKCGRDMHVVDAGSVHMLPSLPSGTNTCPSTALGQNGHFERNIWKILSSLQKKKKWWSMNHS